MIKFVNQNFSELTIDCEVIINGVGVYVIHIVMIVIIVFVLISVA